MARSARASRVASNVPSKLSADRPGHDHVAIVAPSDVEAAAIERDGGPAPGEPAPVRGDERGAGAAAAGAGDPGAALPDPQPDARAVSGPRRRRYWRAAETADDVRGRARAPRDRSPRHRRRRRSHAGCRYWCRPASASGPSVKSTRSVSMARASGMSRQSVRAGPISTATRPSGSASASSNPATVSIRTLGSPVSRREQVGDAARGVAAGLGLAAVGIADAHQHLRAADRAAARAGSPGRSRCRSADRPARAQLRRRSQSRLRRPSSTTKSLPSPCILRNGILPIAAAYMAGRVVLSNSPADRRPAIALHDWAARETIRDRRGRARTR